MSRFKWRSDKNDLACRRNHRFQLQPVPGRDVLDRVRLGCIDLSGSLLLHWFCSKSRSDNDNVACRRDCRCQLQPVPGRDVLYRIRSPFLHCYGTQSRDLTKTIWPAGATTGASCSVCQAGTFLTGSGQLATPAISLQDKI